LDRKRKRMDHTITDNYCTLFSHNPDVPVHYFDHETPTDEKIVSTSFGTLLQAGARIQAHQRIEGRITSPRILRIGAPPTDPQTETTLNHLALHWRMTHVSSTPFPLSSVLSPNAGGSSEPEPQGIRHVLHALAVPSGVHLLGRRRVLVVVIRVVAADPAE
jgi:hypothetical protein